MKMYIQCFCEEILHNSSAAFWFFLLIILKHGGSSNHIQISDFTECDYKSYTTLPAQKTEVGRLRDNLHKLT